MESENTKLYVANLSWGTTDETLNSTFSEFGEVVECAVVRDRNTGRARGFGFVTFRSNEEAERAIKALNETELDGRNIRVSISQDRPAFSGGDRDRGFGQRRMGGGGGRGGFGGGGYNSYNNFMPLVLSNQTLYTRQFSTAAVGLRRLPTIQKPLMSILSLLKRC